MMTPRNAAAARTAKRRAATKATRPVAAPAAAPKAPAKTKEPPVFEGNIPELEDLPKLAALRIMIHHRLRLCHTKGWTWGKVALMANVHISTVSRAAHNVNARTTTGTIFRLAPVLGIELEARYKEDW